MHMLHHVSFGATNMKRSGRFYDATLKALGYKRVYAGDRQIGWGLQKGKDIFAIKRRDREVNFSWSGLPSRFLRAVT